ncbi:MAG: glycosyltransferase family 1 protein, partial [Euryarchaeota archaeon]|nr:glycosyltransferase family 1 protein [Euryarchaeota archaeon]
DERYVREVLAGRVEQERVAIVPYPCHPVSPGGRCRKGEKLRFFSFGRQPVKEYAPYIAALDRLSQSYDLEYLVVRADEHRLEVDRSWLRQEHRRLDTSQIYEYLHASDVHLLPKGGTHYVVVSSTLCQCLGALCPTVAPATRHFEMLPSRDGVAPVVLYSSVDELVEKLRRLIDDESFREGVVRMAEEYVRQNSSEVVARRLKQLMA